MLSNWSAERLSSLIWLKDRENRLCKGELGPRAAVSCWKETSSLGFILEGGSISLNFFSIKSAVKLNSEASPDNSLLASTKSLLVLLETLKSSFVRYDLNTIFMILFLQSVIMLSISFWPSIISDSCWRPDLSWLLSALSPHISPTIATSICLDLSIWKLFRWISSRSRRFKNNFSVFSITILKISIWIADPYAMIPYWRRLKSCMKRAGL